MQELIKFFKECWRDVRELMIEPMYGIHVCAGHGHIINYEVKEMNKKARLNVFKRFTQDLATLSKCNERHVAAIITDKELSQVYSVGINGGPKGLVDCMCNIDGKYGCVHAEINALVKCKSEDKDKVMIVTLSPCKQCAAAIINAPGGFSAVYFVEAWKDDSGIKLLKAAGIKVEQI